MGIVEIKVRSVISFVRPTTCRVRDRRVGRVVGRCTRDRVPSPASATWCNPGTCDGSPSAGDGARGDVERAARSAATSRERVRKHDHPVVPSTPRARNPSCMYYKRGWDGGGFDGTKYFEVWNEPDGLPFATGAACPHRDVYKTRTLANCGANCGDGW